MAMQRGRDQAGVGSLADVAEPRTASRQTSPARESLDRLGLRPICSPAVLKPALLDLQRLVGDRRTARVVDSARTGRNPPQTSPGAPQLQRAPCAGCSPGGDFGRTNIAVARVNVNGEVHYLDAANVAGQVGHHSEMMIATQVQELKKLHGKDNVVIEQLYSERIPCVDCTRMLDDTFKETRVFYTVPEKFTDAMEGAARGRKLMEAYGMKPP